MSVNPTLLEFIRKICVSNSTSTQLNDGAIAERNRILQLYGLNIGDIVMYQNCISSNNYECIRAKVVGAFNDGVDFVSVEILEGEHKGYIKGAQTHKLKTLYVVNRW